MINAMFTAKEAREKQRSVMELNRTPFDEALTQIENEIITCASENLCHMAMTLNIDRTTAKQLKKELKEAGYRGVDFDEYSMGYVVSCYW